MVLSCWLALLLSRVTSQSRIVVGHVVDGRVFDDLKQTMGLFANALPVTCSTGGSVRCSEAIRHVEKAVNENLHWQEAVCSRMNNDCVSY